MARRFWSESRKLEGRSGEVDFERAGIREGDNTRNPEGVLTSQTNATKKDTFARDITLETKEEIKGSLDKAVKILQSYNEMGESVCITYLGHTLYSTDLTLDDAYLEVMGMTRDEWIEELIKKRRARNIDTDIDIDNIDEDGFNADGMDMDDIDVDNIDMDEIMKDVVDIEKEYSFDFDNSSSKEETQSVSNEQLADNKSEVHAEKAELPKGKATKSKSDTNKKRTDSRNNGIRVSKKLGEKLGQRNADTVDYLVRFNRMLEAELSLSSCGDDMRKAISEKMIGLTDLVAKIYKVTKSHVSNDKKKEKIEELVGDLDIVKLTVDLRSEISATKETLIKKAKEAAKNINDKIITEAKQNQESVIVRDEINEIEKPSSIEQAEEKQPFDEKTDVPRFDRKRAREKAKGSKTVEESFDTEEEFDVDKLFEVEGDSEHLEDPEKLFEVEGDKVEKAMIKHEKVGLFGRIKKFFANIKDACTRREEREDVEEFSEEDIDFDDDTSTGFSEDSKVEYTKAGFSAMSKIKNILNAAIEDKSGREVTPNIIESIAERIATFSHDKKAVAMCRGIVKDAWSFTNAMMYNVGDYVIAGGKSGIEAIKKARRETREEGIDR